MNTTTRMGIRLCLLLYPIFLLTVQGGMNAVFFILCVFSAVWLVRQGYTIKECFDRDTVAISIAMSASIVAILLSQAYHENFHFPAYDSASRLLLAILVYIALKNIDHRVFLPLEYSFPLGAIAASCLVLLSNHQRATASFIDLIHFGDLALLLGFLSLLSIRWTHRDSLPLIVFKCVGLVAGIYVSIQTGERGGWIAIPFMTLAWIMMQDIKHKAAWISLALFLIATAIIIAYVAVPIVHARLEGMYFELYEFFWQGQTDRSIGVRLQQWKGVWLLFLQNPLFGIGSDNAGSAMQFLAQSGLISKLAASEAFGELHSDILASLAKYGIFGLLSILAVYIVPLRIFFRSVGAESHFQQTAGMMGVCLVVAFVVFGLTVENFNLKMVAAFYALTVAVLLAAATGRRND